MRTEAGSRWLLSKVSASIPGQLNIDRIQGNLFSVLKLYDVRYELGQHESTIQQVELRLQPIALLKGTIHIKKINLQEVFYSGPNIKEVLQKPTIQIKSIIPFPLDIVITEANLYRLQLTRGGIQHSLNEVYLSGRANHIGLWLERLEVNGDGLIFSLKGHTEFHFPQRFQGKLSWGAELPNDQYARGTGKFSGDLKSIKFTHKLTQPFLVKTIGKIDLNTKRHLFDLKKNRLKADRIPNEEVMQKSMARQSPDKENLESYQVVIKSDLNSQVLPIRMIEIRGRGDLISFQLEKLEVLSLGGTVKSEGKFVWHPQPECELTISASKIDPSVRWSNWPGKLDFNANLQGGMKDGELAVALKDLSLSGHLIEQPLHADGNLILFGNKMVSGELRVLSGSNQLKIIGSASENFDLSFNLETPDPGSFWPDLNGLLRAKGYIKGRRSHPSATLFLEGSNLSYNTAYYGRYSAKTLDAYLKFKSEDMQILNAKINFGNFSLNEESLSGLAFKFFGSPKNHNVQVEFESDSMQTEIEFSGSYFRDVWIVNAGKASIILSKSKIWNLDTPVYSLISHTELKPFKACWVREGSNACVHSSWDDVTGWTATGDLNNSPIKDIVNMLKNSISVQQKPKPCEYF